MTTTRTVVLLVGAAGFLLGAGMVAVGLGRAGGGTPRRSARAWLAALVPTVPAGDEAGLRLAGMTPREYSAQRLGGSLVGLASGAVIGAVTQAAAPGMVLRILAAGAGGWILPMLGTRDAVRKARDEFDQVVRVWIALVAQQVRAGAEPSAAMLDAATAGHRPAWGVLRRFLLAAQHERRPAWEGLADAVDRYGLHSLAPTVSALGLAARRGTRVADAVLVAADDLWRQSVSQQRERAAKRAQIIVVPATGVALGLAAILVYPPFTALTGGLAGAG